jgi:hypothetical protein
MQPFQLVLHETYYQKGFFNIPVAFDQSVRDDNGTIRIYLGNTDDYIDGRVDRTANLNGTARIFGGRELRDWFQREFNIKDVVTVKFLSPEVILLLAKTGE